MLLGEGRGMACCRYEGRLGGGCGLRWWGVGGPLAFEFRPSRWSVNGDLRAGRASASNPIK